MDSRRVANALDGFAARGVSYSRRATTVRDASIDASINQSINQSNETMTE